MKKKFILLGFLLFLSSAISNNLQAFKDNSRPILFRQFSKQEPAFITGTNNVPSSEYHTAHEDSISTENMISQPKEYIRAEKNWGIDINVMRMIAVFSGNFSGGISLFNIDRYGEISFQIYYKKYTNFDYYCENKFEFEHIPLIQFIFDCHYKKFVGGSQKGFFVSVFIRYANIRGMTKDELYDYCHYGGKEPPLRTENKFGAGLGFGYRIFFKNRFYCGVSLSLGRYVFGENNRFYHKWYDPVGPEEFMYPTNDVGGIISFEIFKIGYAF